MRKYLIIALLPLFVYACNIVDDDVQVYRRDSKTFSASQVGEVEVRTENGGIETTVWDDDSVQVVFEKWATGYDEEDAEDNVEDIRIYISEDTTSGVLSIDVDMPKRTGVNYGCDISVRLPPHLYMDLETSNGAITVSESQDGFECSTSNGAIVIQDTQGNAALRTSNGKIIVRNHYGELNGRTSNGKIDADVILPRQGECELKTSNGSIVLSIPNTTSAVIKASTSSGKIEVEDLRVAISRMGKGDFEGTMRDGEANIELETSNGSVLIKRSS